ncbi:MAG: parallel beta-helix repeat protein [Verrucomicrobiales bacterium]|jgi:parallel beta-helix repeat protein
MITRIILSLLLFAVPAFAQDSPVKINSADYPNLQAAFDAVPESGGIVHLAAARYEITEPLIVRTPETRLEGAGASTHIVNLNEEGKPALHIRPDAYAENQKTRLWRVQLGNFRISGNEKSGDGVLAEGIQEIFIHGLSVDHNGRHGINLTDCYEDPRVADSILTYNAEAGLNILHGHDIVVNANHFEENLDGLRCIDGFNLTCNANNFDDHLQHGIVIENTYGSVATGNMIEECNGIAIILDRDCYGITLSANVIAHDMGGGIDLRDASGCSVSANTFVLVHKFGIRVSEDSSRIAVSGNNFSNSYTGAGEHRRKLEHELAIQLDVGAGVVLEGTEDVVVSGNIFAGVDGKAVSCEGECKRISVTGNIVTDFGRRQEVDVAIDEPGDDASIVKDNIVSRP